MTLHNQIWSTPLLMRSTNCQVQYKAVILIRRGGLANCKEYIMYVFWTNSCSSGQIRTEIKLGWQLLVQTSNATVQPDSSKLFFVWNMRTETHVIFALAYKLRVVLITHDPSIQSAKVWHVNTVNIFLSHTRGLVLKHLSRLVSFISRDLIHYKQHISALSIK